jgi:hypothetical protein
MAPSLSSDCARIGTIVSRIGLAMVPTQALPGHSDYAIAALAVMAGPEAQHEMQPRRAASS